MDVPEYKAKLSFAIEVQKAQVYKFDIPTYRWHQARKLIKESKYSTDKRILILRC